MFQGLKRRRKIIKKFAITLLVLTVMAGTCSCASPSDAKNTFGLDLPALGWLQRNSSGQINADFGINYALGFSYRSYIEPLKTNQLVSYWSVGTVAVIFPYIGVGLDYVWDNGFYCGCEVIWIVPMIHGGFMF